MKMATLCRALRAVCVLSAALLGGAAWAAPGQPKLRDVLATAFLYPFLTDAEVDIHFSDTHGRITSRGGPVLFRYPGIAAVSVGGRRLNGQLVGPDLLQAALPAGAHEVTVIPGRPARSQPAFPRCPQAVSTPEAFMERAGQLRPGEELVVADGAYADWRVQVAAAGTAEQPILIRPQTPGGVTFRRASRIRLTGRFLILKGFRFDHCGPDVVVHLAGAEDCRVTQCHFFHCGNPANTFGHIVRVDMGSHRNRVDHCYFTGSKSMSLAQRISDQVEVGVHNRFDHNLFRDIHRYWINGQENIQIGQNQRGASGAAESFCLVERNLFDNAWGDSEIISNKSSRNIIRHNVAAHCQRSAFTLRGGDNVRFEGNVMINNGDGIRVMGRRHLIVNNLILDQARQGIVLETGHQDGESNVATEGALIAHNTILNCPAGAIGGQALTESRPHPPSGNAFQNNLLVGSSGMLLDTRFFAHSTVRRNLFWATGSAAIGERGEEARVANPRLEGEGWFIRPAADSPALKGGLPLADVTRDRWNWPRPAAPALGADEVGAEGRGGQTVVLPPIPPRPLLAPELYRQRVLFVQDPAQPLAGWRQGDAAAEDGAIRLADASLASAWRLPADFVLQWEHRPSTFASRATLTFAAAETGEEYTLSWGGVAGDGKPSGVILLRKGPSGAVVADGADILQYYQDFRFQGWLNTTPNTDSAPDPDLWRRFTLLKQGGRLILLLGDARRPKDPGMPVLIWQDDGAAARGAGLRIGQEGAGSWRAFTLWAYGYVGDVRPPAPAGLKAEAHGSGRITLRWNDGRRPDNGHAYDIHRAARPDFTPSPQNRIAEAVQGSRYDDFAVQPGLRYHYQVRAVNALGLASGYARVAAATGAGGPLYRLIDAAQARAVAAPMALATDPVSGRRSLWAPPGSPVSMEEPPQEGIAEFRFVVEQAGEYALWGLVQAPDESADSFHAALDALEGGAFRIWHVGPHRSWGWSRILPPVRLAAGQHVLRIKHREPGAHLAAVLITNDLEYGTPSR